MLVEWHRFFYDEWQKFMWVGGMFFLRQNVFTNMFMTLTPAREVVVRHDDLVTRQHQLVNLQQNGGYLLIHWQLFHQNLFYRRRLFHRILFYQWFFHRHLFNRQLFKWQLFNQQLFNWQLFNQKLFINGHFINSCLINSCLAMVISPIIV